MTAIREMKILNELSHDSMVRLLEIVTSVGEVSRARVYSTAVSGSEGDCQMPKRPIFVHTWMACNHNVSTEKWLTRQCVVEAVKEYKNA